MNGLSLYVGSSAMEKRYPAERIRRNTGRIVQEDNYKQAQKNVKLEKRKREQEIRDQQLADLYKQKENYFIDFDDSHLKVEFPLRKTVTLTTRPIPLQEITNTSIDLNNVNNDVQDHVAVLTNQFGGLKVTLRSTGSLPIEAPKNLANAQAAQQKDLTPLKGIVNKLNTSVIKK